MLLFLSSCFFSACWWIYDSCSSQPAIVCEYSLLLALTPVRGDNQKGKEGRSAYAPLRYAQHRAVPSLPFSFSPRAPFSLSSLSPVPPSRRPASARSCACAPPSLTFLVLLPSMFRFTSTNPPNFSCFVHPQLYRTFFSYFMSWL